MDHTASASFDVTNWDATPYDEPSDGPRLTRVAVSKAFTGGLDGESVGEGLFCGMNAPTDGAGYVVSERFSGRLGGRSGTFVLHHVGVAPPDGPARSFGNVGPGRRGPASWRGSRARSSSERTTRSPSATPSPRTQRTPPRQADRQSATDP